ncbi:MAG TPA: PQQ-dependent sugar dehydrogenase [Trueperaceae bacterium]|nr:PQQ-dependent sugar dehydrogenase [Trueperaceae bacterium]
MRRLSSLIAGLVLLLLLSCSATAQRLEPVVSGLKQPVVITHANDDRLFVVEQVGIISVAVAGELLSEPFLDIADQVASGGERGLLGLAFPVDHANTGRFYVYYTDRQGNTAVSRFMTGPDPNRADRGSETILLTQEQPYSNHNGGQLAFGPDGYLYIGLGDGGSGGDPEGYGQDLDTFLGKLLRIDVAGQGYTVPSDNPFVGVEGARPEIWAYGLRNPWRFGFDRVTGDLYIADVGQNAFEEVNLQPAASAGGENYGWNIMEAGECYSPRSNCDQTGLVLPILSYPHGGQWGSSISGGYLYRGSAVPSLEGHYVFADFVSGRIWTAAAASDWSIEPLLETGFNIATFGEDAAGELYVADYGGGVIYRFGVGD